jgi:type IV secretory pathway TraG/TraD family ATPase VirD4
MNNEYISTVLINTATLSMAYAGANIDDRFLELYQFIMWGFVLIAIFALFIPSKDLFKTSSNNKYQGFFNWCFSIIKTLVSVWVGMSILAAFYLVVTVLCSAKKKAYFDDLNTTK